jgi:DNA-binding response OmpR family regulator
MEPQNSGFRSPGGTRTKPGRDSKKILIIDDNPAVRHMLCKLLGEYGYRTATADDGLKALQAARTENPDLILLDVMLPGMDGFTVCRMIKFDRQLKGIPVIILTSRMGEEDEKTAMQVGADAYIVKAVRTVVILDKIRELLNRPSAPPAPGD